MTVFIRNRNYTAAISAYTSKLLETTNCPTTLTNRAFAYFHLQKYPEAICDCQQALEINKCYTKAWWRLGRCYEMTNQWELAWKTYIRIYKCKESQEKLIILRPLIMGPHFTKLEQLVNISTPSFCVSNMEKARGLIACKPIRDKSNILSIPIQNLITKTSGRKTPWGNAFQPFEKETKDSFLVYLVFALTQRLIQTPNDPYMLTMPNNTSSMPFFWSEEQLSRLGLSFIREQIIERKQNFVTIYEILQQHVSEFAALIPQQKFLYLISLTSTRNFTVLINHVKEQLMVPFADMINHRSCPNTHWFYNNEIDAFQLDATQDIEMGEMMYDSYGNRDNAFFMSVYGFSIPMNKFDRVRIMPSLFLHRDGNITNKQFTKYRTHFKGTPQEVERHLLTYIFDKIKSLSYPSSLKEDEEWLKTHTDYTPEYFIRVALVSEKHILKEWTNIIEECLGNPTKRQRKKWKSGKNERLYLKTIWSRFKVNLS